MKSKIAVIMLAVFLCLTTGCNNSSHIAETPDPISSSDSNIVPSESETAQAEKKTEVDRPQSTESQTDSRAAEFPASVSESATQPTEVPDQADHSTAVLPQPSEPEKKTDESERRPETAAPTEKEQPTPPATEESTPPEPPKEEPTEPVFGIDYWISFAKSYAESIGLALDRGAVYCWDNPIAAGEKCKYTERDIRGYLDRYAKDDEITDVWIWYEQTGSGSYEIYIGYALELAKLLNISDTQLSYITNVDAGHGLIKVGSSLVPFANKFPKNTKLYKLMTTKPGEGA